MDTIIYTCITNGYDDLKEIKTIHRAICFTDMDISSESWEIIKITDKPKLNRKIKLCPHLFLPPHKRNVWIDGNVETTNIDQLIAEKTGFWCMKHPKRICAYVEGVYCIDIKKDTEENLLPQLNKYLAEGFPIDYGLIYGGFLIRDDSKENRALAELWWNEVNTHSTRDQVSFPYAAWKLNFSYSTMPFLKDWSVAKHPGFIKELEGAIKAKDFKIADSIIIAGEQGSGSSWLVEVLKSRPDTLINYEPFHAKSGIVPPELKLGETPYLPEDDDRPGYVELMQEILSLKRISGWTLKHCGMGNILYGNKVVSKLVGGQMLLPWLVKNCSFNHPPIHIVRHPVATAIFQLEAQGLNAASISNYEVPEWLNNERYILHSHFISSLSSSLEQTIAVWCINNIPVINHQARNKKWLTVYYEDLVLNPGDEFRRILNALSLTIDDAAIAAVSQADKNLSDEENRAAAVKSLNKWQGAFTAAELEQFQAIFDYFGLEVYTAADALPIKTAGTINKINTL